MRFSHSFIACAATLMIAADVLALPLTNAEMVASAHQISPEEKARVEIEVKARRVQADYKDMIYELDVRRRAIESNLPGWKTEFKRGQMTAENIVEFKRELVMVRSTINILKQDAENKEKDAQIAIEHAVKEKRPL